MQCLHIIHIILFVLIESRISKYPEEFFEPGVSINLKYVSGTSPNSFLCQYSDDIIELEFLMREIKGYMASLESVDSIKNFMVGDPVIAKYSKDETWYRGLILSHDVIHKTVEVLFVDRGNVECVPTADTMAIPPKFTALKRQIINCRLGTISGKTLEQWPNEAFVKFEELTMNCEGLSATIIESGTDPVVVSLKSDTCSDFATSIM